ncbi:hypothetical protein FRB90_002750 [Tulasnella sp. 427]|nr:hypothetical protein FRB90_002750 [Tulasnella sp. 427]
MSRLSSPISPITQLPPSGDVLLERVTSRAVETPDVQAEREGIDLGGEQEPTPVGVSRRASTISSLRKPPIRVVKPFDFRVITLIMPSAVFGLLARLGLDALATYPGQSIFPLAWVQAAGCFAMGGLLGLREPISEFYPELYIALTSGFCGSLTTFSSWQLDVFLAWSNKTTPGGYSRIWIYDIMDGLTRLLFTLAISLAALSLGFKITTETAPALQRLVRKSKGPPSQLTHILISIISILIYVLTIPMYFVLSPSFRVKATAALLFSFPGAFLRYFLSVHLNKLHTTIPPGTLTANTLGCFLLAAFHVLERSKGGRLSGTSCAMLVGLSDGFCGCLTTVSTYAAELRTLPRWKAWRYGLLSIVLGQIAMVLVIGSAEWSGAVHERSTCI